jgi:non-ribosomal peptide synthetase component F
MSFKELLLQVRQCIIEAAENQNFPLETLPQDLNLPVSPAEFPLFDITVLLENIHYRKYIEHLPTNINFSFIRTGEKIEGKVEYNAILYDGPVMEQLVCHFLRLLEQGISRADTPLSQRDLLSEDEKNRLLYDFNDTYGQYLRDKTLHQLFEEQVEKSPDNIALLGEKDEMRKAGSHLSYRELDKISNGVAYMLNEKGVQPDTIVGLMIERSMELVIGILGILKAGGAYLPISTELPETRKEYILQDSNAKILLTSVLPVSPGAKKQPGAYSLQPAVRLAYVIYTSGSTGKPKGVLIEHRSILNYVSWRIRTYPHTAKDISIQLVAFSFDGFGSNLYPVCWQG